MYVRTGVTSPRKVGKVQVGKVGKIGGGQMPGGVRVRVESQRYSLFLLGLGQLMKTRLFSLPLSPRALSFPPPWTK